MNLHENPVFVHSDENYQVKVTQFLGFRDILVTSSSGLNDALMLSPLCVNCMVVTSNIHLGNIKMTVRLFHGTPWLVSAGKEHEL